MISGTVYTNIPQSYSVHSGTRSLYLNFVDCAGGTGTCAGDTVFKREISVCPNTALRISSFLTTTFSGGQCNMNIVILDANNMVLDNTPSILADYSPLWTPYQSSSFTSPTTTITFVMITNTDGGNGNDLSMDDFLVENCAGSLNLGSDTILCNTQSLVLSADSGYSSYSWNNGTTAQTLTASTTWTGGSINIFYSVTQIDSNGCSSSDTIEILFVVCAGINEINGNNLYSVYHNPDLNELTLIFYEHYLPDATFVLYDGVGRMLKTVRIQDKNQTIPLAEVNSGMYFYQITEKEKVIAAGKVLLK